MTPTASIIVINRDDRGVGETLQALVSLDEVIRGEAEVIVVDASEGRLDDLAQRFSTVRWITYQPIPGRVTIPHQRNVGVHVSYGEIIVFIDASCVPGPQWLSRITEPIASGRETIVAGSHRTSGAHTLRDQATHRLAGRDHLNEAPTINVALNRALFDQVGDFDESFDYGSDVDLSWRATAAGHRIRYLPEAEVSHDWGDIRADARRSYVYGRARARLYRKHPQRWRDLFGRDIQALVYPMYLLLLPATLRRPYVHLVLAIPLWRNRGMRPLITIAEHFVYAAGVLTELRAVPMDQVRRRPPSG